VILSLSCLNKCFCYYYYILRQNISENAWNFLVSATISIVLPPQSKFVLNIILASTKFIQHQTVSRSALKYSPNVDIHNLWTVTSSRAPTRTYSMTFTKTQKTYFRDRSFFIRRGGLVVFSGGHQNINEYIIYKNQSNKLSYSFIYKNSKLAK
jgi:hypothetical protein